MSQTNPKNAGGLPDRHVTDRDAPASPLATSRADCLACEELREVVRSLLSPPFSKKERA